MALVEPLVGHLLSQYAETVHEGFSKIKKNAQADPTFVEAFAGHPQGMQALRDCLTRSEYAVPTLHTICALIDSCGDRDGARQGSRVNIIREFCRGDTFSVIRKALSSVSDETLPLNMAAFQFLSLAARYAPKMILVRFNNKLQLHLACFRSQLPYSQRRLRLSRITFLLDLAESRYYTGAADVVCTHGYLTCLLEDAAELLQEGTPIGIQTGKRALKVFQERFITASAIPIAQKRTVLMAQRNVFRLLVKALEFPPVAEDAAALMYHLVNEMVESPSDYASTRVESTEHRGMPNFITFFLLRQLRPKNSVHASRMVVYILNKTPDLIRPYFTRVSGHLADEGNSQRVAASTARIATLNVMTRIMLAPIPYHLAARRVTLQPIAAKSDTFYTMSPRDVADEICPPWVAEYTHRIINGSTNLMFLTLAMQLTAATLQRAKTVLTLIARIQREQLQQRTHGRNDEGNQSTEDADLDILAQERILEDAESFDTSVQAALLAALPSREEFWHRVTQQLHPLMLTLRPRDTTSTVSAETATQQLAKLEFTMQRMFLLMDAFTDVLQLRTSWQSAVPSWLPALRPGTLPITDALRGGNDLLQILSGPSVSTLCALLTASLTRGVPMIKLHHINMSNPRGGITEWPLLLSILLWAVRNREKAAQSAATAEAVAWAARLLQWVVHSVTVRYGCEFDEAMQWILTIPVELLPCFLYLLNSLLQRSLSKAADKVAQGLEGECTHSVLLSAAEAFIAKTEEKLQAAAADAPRNLKPKTAEGKKGPTNALAAVELWADDLRAHLPSFKQYVAAVQKQWRTRHDAATAFVHPLVAAKEETRGRKRFVLIRNVASSQDHLLVPLHTQLQVFCTSLRAPATVSSSTNEELQLRAAMDHAPLGTIVMSGSKGSTTQKEKSVMQALKTLGVARWMLKCSACWDLAGRLLRDLDAAVARLREGRGKHGRAQMEEVMVFAHHLLGSVVAAGADVTAVLGQQRDVVTVGFFIVILAALRVLLTASRLGQVPVSMTAAAMDDLAVVLLRAYSGTVSTADRVRYACLLSLHYLTDDGEAAALRAPTEGASDDEDKDDSEEVAAAKKGLGTAARCSHVLTGVTVPTALQKNRFLIGEHIPGAHYTAEVDMLAYLAESLTDAEIREVALEWPARLHNSLLYGSTAAAWDMLRSVFPEITSRGDFPVTCLAQVTAPTTLDPRYLLPLVQTVVSLPAEQLAAHRFLGSRCVPVLLRALSFTDPWLRAMAASALALAYLPQGPRRVVASFARMKCIQLAEKKQRAAYPSGSGAAGGRMQTNTFTEVPRLPAPLSAFLVLAMEPIGRYDDPLHNHIIRFLIEPRTAFTVPVPFVQWCSRFPLAAVSMPLMIEQQEELQKTSRSDGNTNTEMSTGEAISQMRQCTPPQLTFILALVCSSCKTNGDAAALIESECLTCLMMLASLVTSSSSLRLKIVECLHAVCAASFAVAAQLAQEGGLLLWLLSFVSQLCREYGGQSPALYRAPLFLSVLNLVEKLCRVALQSGEVGSSGRSQAHHRDDRPVLRGQEVLDQLKSLQATLRGLRVTSKDTLDKVESILALWKEPRRTATGVPATAAARDRKRVQDEPSSETPAKKTRKA